METSLYDRFSNRFDVFPGDDVDCLGFGETPPFPPVLLHLRAKNGTGEARALFFEEPSGEHYELLKAIGVEYLGGSWEGPYFVARFRNDLPTHIHSGILAHFSRTSHCNRFFLRHGSIDEQLEDGLMEASTNRVNWGAERAREAVLGLANEAGNGEELALVCHPPPPAEPFVCGDVVPLGFVLGVLNYHTSAASIFSNFEVRRKLMSILQRKQQESLWPHQTGGPVSATATALVLQGLYDPESVQRLEVFAARGRILFPPRDRRGRTGRDRWRRTSWQTGLCNHVPDTGPEERCGSGPEDQRRAPGGGFSEQERTILRQPVPGRLGAGPGVRGR